MAEQVLVLNEKTGEGFMQVKDEFRFDDSILFCRFGKETECLRGDNQALEKMVFPSLTF